MRKQTELLRCDLGDSFFLRYQEVSNGRGGYRPVNMALYQSRSGQDTLIRRLTTRHGFFLRFPGVVHGQWERKLTGLFRRQVRFAADIGQFQGDCARFSWLVQPDGFYYYMDEDGFGGEDDDEIWLYALINKKGIFVTPFSETPPSPFSGG